MLAYQKLKKWKIIEAIGIAHCWVVSILNEGGTINDKYYAQLIEMLQKRFDEKKRLILTHKCAVGMLNFNASALKLVPYLPCSMDLLLR